ncbi:MAG TPA: SpoIIE family protein phosphatase, partial [Solirubrobacteraceae bacterium]|nr:SpoIIE family protein phosphatase [Solirubrobacteraceae bacterium]
TDGVIDALGAEERFGSARLKRLLAEHAGEAPEGLLRALAAGLDRFQVGPQADDTAALALRPTPVAAGAGAQASHPTHGSRTLPVT